MLLTEKFYKRSENIWQSLHEHPFVKEIEDGTLAKEKFRFYMIQDYLYLLEYAKVFAIGLIKSRDEGLARKFAAHIHHTLDGEMDTHKAYMTSLGITTEEVSTAKRAIANQSYTSYMIDAASSGDVLDSLTAILACAWSYQAIAQKIVENNPEATKHPFYGKWVSTYTSGEYKEAVQDLLDLTNQYGESIAASRSEYLIQLFINCCRFEYEFWNMAYHMEM